VKLGEASINASDREILAAFLGAAFLALARVGAFFFARADFADFFAAFFAAMSFPPGARGYDRETAESKREALDALHAVFITPRIPRR
jgi:hypothetical protein